MFSLKRPIPALVLAVGLVAMGPSACREGDSDPQGAGEPSVERPEPARTVAEEADQAAPPELPARGEVIVRRGEGGLTVLARQAPRLEVVRALARVGGFALVDRAARHPAVTLVIVDAPLEEVLVRVLEDTPYQVGYAVRERGRGVEVATVVIGTASPVDPLATDAASAPARATPDAQEPGGNEEDDEARRLARQQERARRYAELKERQRAEPPSEAELRWAAEQRARRQESRREELLEEVESPDVETREFAAMGLDAEREEDRLILENLLLGDSDASVRRQAAIQLGFGPPRDVLPVLEGALADSDSEVVIAAIRSLAFLDDRSAIARLAPLTQHRELAVREAAEEAVELLEALP